MLIGLSAAAQVKDISLSAGVNVPIYKDLESDAVIKSAMGNSSGTVLVSGQGFNGIRPLSM